jgi:hypothetical protein
MPAETIEDLLKEAGEPDGELPPAPPWHVESESHACLYGWIRYGAKPEWILCNCEDPASPWPARVPGDGPRDCACFGCQDHEPRWERGKLAACEHKDHHCQWCHEQRRCSIAECGFWTT